MDTRFWGPPGWILLHTLAYAYKPSLKSEYSIFFDNLKYVLPCIYCRVSYTEYIEDLPIHNFLDSRDNFFNWLYQIHNMVNNKLRSQGLLNWENPSVDEIKNKFKDLSKEFNQCKIRDKSIMGWNFLYCIAFVFPEDGKNTAQTSQYHGYLVFFNILAKILPDNYKILYSDYLHKNPIIHALECRDTLKQWIYNLELYINNYFKLQCSDFVDIEDLIESYRAGCGGKTADSKPTCRRISK